MDEVVKAIEEALERKGMSAAAASRAAVGNPSLIKNLVNRRASQQAHPYENLKALADVLGLELYFGPPRETGPVVTVAPDGDFGHEFALISTTNVEAAAGAGRYVSGLEEREPLAFRRDWLAKLDVTPSSAVLLRARGESMEPLIWDGDVMMIDTDRTEPRIRPEGRIAGRGFQDEIFVLRLGEDLRVKAVRRPSKDKIMLYSENRVRYEPELLSGADLKELTIIGKVVWWGHVSN